MNAHIDAERDKKEREKWLKARSTLNPKVITDSNILLQQDVLFI